MKIVVLGREHEDHNRARARVTPAVLLKLEAVAVKVVVLNVVHAAP
jgi:hypothetical protein